MAIKWPRRIEQTLVLALSGFAISALTFDDAVAAEVEEIIVTATKRAEPLQNAPLSVSVLLLQSPEDADVRDIFDVAALVPSFEATQDAGPLSASWYIRRIGNLGSIPAFEPAVGVFVDGAFRSRAGAAVGDLFDLRQIEIVKGPQTTLHGKNTTAGLVSISTNPPGDEFGLTGSVTAGFVDTIESANLFRLESVVNAPVSSNTYFRAGGVIYRHEETLLNLFNGEHGQDADRYTLRGQVRHSVGDKIEARLIANRFRIDSARLGDLVLFEGNAIRGINTGFGVPCPDHDVDGRVFCRNHASVFDHTSTDVTLDIRATIGGAALSSISSIEEYESGRDFDADQLNIDVVRIVDRQRGSGFSQEFRIASTKDAGPAWFAGAFFLDSEFRRGSQSDATAILGIDARFLEFLPGIPAGNPGDLGYFHSGLDTRHVSVFGNVDWALANAFSVRAGLRWQSEDKTVMVINTADHTEPTVITLQLMPAFADASLSRDTSGTSWELSGRYRWSDTLMTYLAASRGFKSGGFNAGFGATPPEVREYGDEKVDNLEIGLKSVLLDGRLRINAAVFAARYRDFQSAGWVSLRFLVNNAERVDVRGLEFDLQAALGEYLSAAASLSWVDARYDRYTSGSCHFARPPDNGVGTACDLSGHELPLAPRTRANLDLKYDHPLGPGVLHGRIGWSWTGDYHTSSSLDPRHLQDAYSLVDARIGYRFDRWDVMAWVRNAGNQLVVTREGPSNLFPRDPAYGRAFTMPRTFGLTISTRL